MATNKKPRKKYKPRWNLTGFDPIKYVMSGVKRAPDEFIERMQFVMHSAMHALTHGLADGGDWKEIANSLNVTYALCMNGHGKDYMADVRAAQEAHAQCGRRMVSHGSFGYTAAELALVNFAIELHEVQLRELPVVYIEQAVDRVHRMLQNPANLIVVNTKKPTEEGVPA